MGKDDVVESAREELADRAAQVKTLLRAVNAARRQLSMYGPEHPTMLEYIDDLTSFLNDFVSDFGNATCVFIKEGLVVNDHLYPPSPDSLELLNRLRERGAVT